MPPGVPFRVLAALNKYDKYRKCRTGMFEILQQVYAEQGLEIDLDKSVFVGDAAGRLGGIKGQMKDHADTDYKFALNVGIEFLTPEVGTMCLLFSDKDIDADYFQEYFLGHPKPVYPRPPNGFRPSEVGALGSCKSRRQAVLDRAHP